MGQFALNQVGVDSKPCIHQPHCHWQPHCLPQPHASAELCIAPHPDTTNARARAQTSCRTARRLCSATAYTPAAFPHLVALTAPTAHSPAALACAQPCCLSNCPPILYIDPDRQPQARQPLPRRGEIGQGSWGVTLSTHSLVPPSSLPLFLHPSLPLTLSSSHSVEVRVSLNPRVCV